MTDVWLKESADAAYELMEEMRPLLAGKGADVQSAALADLTAMWLSGVFLTNPDGIDEKATAQMRADMLTAFIDTVRRLIPVNEAMFTRPMLEKRLGRR